MRFIDDGYTLRAGVGSFAFEFRPMLPRERLRLLEQMRFADGWFGEAWHHADQMLAEHIVAVDVHQAWNRVRNLRSEDFGAWERVFNLVTNVGNDAQEEADRNNLQTGIGLLRKYGHLRGASTCDQCRQWLFDPESGQFEVDDETGERIPRFEEAVLACQTQEGCPNGTPENPLSLSDKNRQAFRHYQECVATSHFPDDPIVRQNAAIIRAALIRCQRRANNAATRPVEVLVPIHEPAREGLGRGSVPAGSGAG